MVLILGWLVAGVAAPLGWLGLTLLAGGAWLWIRPPRSSGGRGAELAVLALGIWMAAAFLPVPGSWRGHWWEEAFRLGLDQPLVHQAGRRPERDLTSLGFDWEIPPPATLQPWATIEVLLYLPLAAAVLYGLGTLGVSAAGRRRWREVLELGALAAAPAAWAWAAVRPDPGLVEAGGWPNPVGWGLAAVAMVWLGPGRDGGGRRGVALRVLAAAWLVGWAVALAGWVPAGAVAGCVLARWGWARWRPAAAGWSGHGWPVLAGGLLGAILIAGMMDRSTPGRLAVLRDAAAMLADQPLIGVGPGNVDVLVAQYRVESLETGPVPHLRSDWMQLAAARGFPGLAAGLAVLGFALTRLRRLDQAEDPGQRAACAAGLAVILAGSVVDIPLHTPGVALLGCLLYIMARPLRRPQWALVLHPVVWRGVGGVTLALGLVALLTATLRLPMHSEVVLPRRPISWSAEVNPAWTLDRWHEHMAAVGSRPLSAREFFERARTRAEYGKFLRLLPVDLARARFLAPDRPELPLWEGVIWWQRQPSQAWAAWGRALVHPLADQAEVVAVIRATVPDTEENRERLAGLIERFGRQPREGGR